MTVSFSPPPHAPEGFLIPDLEVVETPDSLIRIMDGVSQGDYVEFIAERHGRGVWVRNDEHSAALLEERLATAQAMGVTKRKRVLLDSERLLSSNGIPALVYEFPSLVQPFLTSMSAIHRSRGNTSNAEQSYSNSEQALSIDAGLTNLDAVLHGFNLWQKLVLPKLDLATFLTSLTRVVQDRDVLNSIDHFTSQSLITDVAPRVDKLNQGFQKRKMLQKKIAYYDKIRKDMQYDHNRKLITSGTDKNNPNASQNNIDFDENNNDDDDEYNNYHRSIKHTPQKKAPISHISTLASPLKMTPSSAKFRAFESSDDENDADHDILAKRGLSVENNIDEADTNTNKRVKVSIENKYNRFIIEDED